MTDTRTFIRKETVFFSILFFALTFLYHSIVKIPYLYEEWVIPEIHVHWSFFARPLSSLSFVAIKKLFGISPAPQHLLNLLIHFINCVLIYRIAPKGKIFTTTFFAFHPLATACVSQAYGRNYSLATLFLLLALQTENQIFIWVCLVLMILTKQSFVFFLGLLVWLSISQKEKIKRPWVWTVMALAVLAMIIGYALPLSKTSISTPTVYFLSQLGNWDHLVSLFFLPFQTSFIHEFPFFTSVSRPVIEGALLLGALLYLILKNRGAFWSLCLGFALIALFSTNSFFPKNEVIREWRLYPVLVFVSLFVGDLLDSKKQKILRLLFPVLIFLFAITVFKQNKIYQSNASAWAQVARKYPYSSDAKQNLGVSLMMEKKWKEAHEEIEKAIELDPKIALYYKALSYCSKQMELLEQSKKENEKYQEVLKKYGDLRMSPRIYQSFP